MKFGCVHFEFGHRTMQSVSICIIIAVVVVVDYGFAQSYHLSSYRFRRPRCQTVFPTRAQLFHSQSIVLVGRVEQVRPLDDASISSIPVPGITTSAVAAAAFPQQQQSASSDYMATVLVRRMLHGPSNLQRQRIQVAGFNPYGPPGTTGSATGEPAAWCHPNTEQGDSWIFVLQPVSYPIQHYRLNASLIKVTLANLDKFDAIIADKPYGFRPPVADLPCEMKYCPNNGNCLEDPYAADGARCECLAHCKSKYEPICGSDFETYNNECELRLRSCRAGKNLFVLGLNSCYHLRSGSLGAAAAYPRRTNSNQSSTASSSERYRTTNTVGDTGTQTNYRMPQSGYRTITETKHHRTDIRTSTTLDRPTHPY